MRGAIFDGPIGVARHVSVSFDERRRKMHEVQIQVIHLFDQHETRVELGLYLLFSMLGLLALHAGSRC